MNQQKLTEFMADVQRLCDKYHVYCEMTTKAKPKLEYVEVRLQAKVTESA